MELDRSRGRERSSDGKLFQTQGPTIRGGPRPSVKGQMQWGCGDRAPLGPSDAENIFLFQRLIS